MNPGEEILYNSMCAIIEKLNAIESAMHENTILSYSEGVTLQEIADLKKISVSHLRRQPWLLPFEDPEYGKKPFSYSKRQIIKHEQLIREKGFEAVKRMWQERVKAARVDAPSRSSPGTSTRISEKPHHSAGRTAS